MFKKPDRKKNNVFYISCDSYSVIINEPEEQ